MLTTEFYIFWHWSTDPIIFSTILSGSHHGDCLRCSGPRAAVEEQGSSWLVMPVMELLAWMLVPGEAVWLLLPTYSLGPTGTNHSEAAAASKAKVDFCKVCLVFLTVRPTRIKTKLEHPCMLLFSFCISFECKLKRVYRMSCHMILEFFFFEEVNLHFYFYFILRRGEAFFMFLGVLFCFLVVLSFIAVHGFSFSRWLRREGHSGIKQCMGFLWRLLWFPRSTGSGCLGISSCSMRAQ